MEGRGRDPGRQDNPSQTHATRLGGITRLLRIRLPRLRAQPPHPSPQKEAHLEMTYTVSFVGFTSVFYFAESLWDLLPPELTTIIMMWKEVAELQGPRDTHRNKLSIVHAEMAVLHSFLYCSLCDQLHHDLIPVWFEERYGPHRIPSATWTALRLQWEGKLPPTLNITKLYLKS